MAAAEDGVVVRRSEDRDRYEALVDGAVAGFLEYRIRPGRIVFTHSETAEAFAGRGIGSRVAAFALDAARTEGLGVTPLCPFVQGFIERHPEYADMVVKPGAGPP